MVIRTLAKVSFYYVGLVLITLIFAFYARSILFFPVVKPLFRDTRGHPSQERRLAEPPKPTKSHDHNRTPSLITEESCQEN